MNTWIKLTSNPFPEERNKENDDVGPKISCAKPKIYFICGIRQQEHHPFCKQDKNRPPELFFKQEMGTLLHHVILLPSSLTGTASHQTRIPLIKCSNRGLGTPPRAQGSRGFGVPAPADHKSRSKGDDPGLRGEGSSSSSEDDEIPQVVLDRMLRRILISVGTPMASGFGLVYLEELVKKGGLWEVPAWLPLLTILLSFGTSGMGIAYGTLSSSWDPEKEGSLLGWEQAQKNWPELWKEENK